jgi:hypothetical protein
MLDLDLKQLISGLPVSPYIRTGATTGRSPLRWPARQRLLPSDTVSCNEMPAGWNELMPYGLFAAAKPRICRFKLRTGISKATEISANDKFEVLETSKVFAFQGLLERSRQSIKAGKGLWREDFWKAVAERTRDKQSGGRVASSED